MSLGYGFCEELMISSLESRQTDKVKTSIPLICHPTVWLHFDRATPGSPRMVTQLKLTNRNIYLPIPINLMLKGFNWDS